MVSPTRHSLKPRESSFFRSKKSSFASLGQLNLTELDRFELAFPILFSDYWTGVWKTTKKGGGRKNLLRKVFSSSLMDGNTSNEKDVEWVERWQKPDCLVRNSIWTLLAPSPEPAAASLIQFRSTGMPKQWWWPVLLLRDYFFCPARLTDGSLMADLPAWPYFFLRGRSHHFKWRQKRRLERLRADSRTSDAILPSTNSVYHTSPSLMESIGRVL